MIQWKQLLATFVIGLLCISQPVSARFLSDDPVNAQQHIEKGNVQGFNRFSYANNNPYRYVDPDGREVAAIYNLSTKALTVTDVDTQSTITIKAVSGGKPFGDPIPTGKYEILDQGRNPDSYRLDAVDSSPTDDRTDSGRSLLRVHGPGNTIGCIAAEDAEAWSSTQEILNNTKTTTVTDNSTPWYKSTESIKKYGELEVVDSEKDE